MIPGDTDAAHGDMCFEKKTPTLALVFPRLRSQIIGIQVLLPL